ncbi:MAG: hypothetical protein SOY07_00125 [Bacteroidales bacterium]|nr:hypothetical protein [Bacteroidales bacterium]
MARSVERAGGEATTGRKREAGMGATGDEGRRLRMWGLGMGMEATTGRKREAGMRATGDERLFDNQWVY